MMDLTDEEKKWSQLQPAGGNFSGRLLQRQ